MVCPRCISAVEGIMNELDIPFTPPVLLGEVELVFPLSSEKKEMLSTALSDAGFVLLEEKEDVQINRIKQVIIDWIHHGRQGPKKINVSQYIAQEVGADYSSLSKLFSSYEGITIEKYIIKQKIERAKELLIYGEQSLTEISYLLDYSSPQHLSRQFKQVTGMSPTDFQHTHGHLLRKPLNEV